MIVERIITALQNSSTIIRTENEFTNLERFPELPFQDGEYCFDFVSLMILRQIKQLHYFSSIISGDSFLFSSSDQDKGGTRFQPVPDQPVDFFRILSFVHDIVVGLSGSVRSFQEFFSVRDIVDRVLGYLQTRDDLKRSIDGNRSFQEPFSGLTGSPGIVVAGVRASKPG